MLRAVKCTGVITFHSSKLLDSPTTLGGLPCFCCMFHFTLINLVHISYFVQKNKMRHRHSSLHHRFPPQCSDHPATLFLHPSLYSSSLTSSSRILVWTVGHFFSSLGQKVEAKLGFDVILINGMFKMASRLFFLPPLYS